MALSSASMKWALWPPFREAVAVGANGRHAARPDITDRQRFNCWRLSLLTPDMRWADRAPPRQAKTSSVSSRTLSCLSSDKLARFTSCGITSAPTRKRSTFGQASQLESSFIWTPTNASWLNLIEPWFLVLQRTALYNTNPKKPKPLRNIWQTVLIT
jgi:hypothetical protein